jgi:beta-lactamase superfamily II metal-dependent hydrolase
LKLKILLGTFIVGIFFLFQVISQINNNTLPKTYFVFCEVGEGDGAILITRENVFLIDAGRDGRMTECLQRHLPFWKRDITGVILTHPDADHMNGLNSVIKSYRVKWLFSNFSPNKSGEYRKLYDALVNSGVVVESFVAGEQINVKNLNSKFEIASLWPLNQHHEYESTNLFSTISTVTIGASQFLMLADSEIATQLNLLPQITKMQNANLKNQNDNAKLKILGDIRGNQLEISENPSDNNKKQSDKSESGNNKYLVVKVSHHGSAKNFSYTLMREVSPQYAIVSVGKNSYGHPGKKVLELLEKLGIKILRTDKTGDIIFECESKCLLKN